MPKFTGPHDYFNKDYVDDWAQAANSRRPHRRDFFDAFVKELSELTRPKLLDLGAGPGFLAEQVLDRSDAVAYHLLDFSPRMLELARDRLERFGRRVSFHQVDFMKADWWRSLPTGFDAAVSLQAVHEVRGGDNLSRLYEGVRSLVVSGGKIIIADKLDFETEEGRGHLTVEDHEMALARAGFRGFRRVLEVKDLIMFEATLEIASAGD